MQVFPQSLPFVQWGGFLPLAAAVAVLAAGVAGAVAAGGHLMNLPVFESLHLLAASAAPAVIVAIASATVRILVTVVPPRWSHHLRRKACQALGSAYGRSET